MTGPIGTWLMEKMKDVSGATCFENCETEFHQSRCIPQGGVCTPVFWRRVAQYGLWKAGGKRKAKGWEISFGGEGDDEFLFSGMIWAGNCFFFSDDKVTL